MWVYGGVEVQLQVFLTQLPYVSTEENYAVVLSFDWKGERSKTPAAVVFIQVKPRWKHERGVRLFRSVYIPPPPRASHTTGNEDDYKLKQGCQNELTSLFCITRYEFSLLSDGHLLELYAIRIAEHGHLLCSVWSQCNLTVRLATGKEHLSKIKDGCGIPI
jgi:hypothetical protein